MQPLMCVVVVVCACVGLCASHVLIDTANGLVGTASILLDSDIGPPDNKINSLDHMLTTSANNVFTVKRFKRDFIGTAHCPMNTVRVGNSCVKCKLYEELTEQPCPVKTE